MQNFVKTFDLLKNVRDSINEMLVNVNRGRKVEFHKIESQDRRYFFQKFSKIEMITKFTRLKKALGTLG
jgi:hypothetical protein